MQELQVMSYYVRHGLSRIEYLLTYAAAKNSKLRFELSSLRTEPRVDWLVTLSYDEAKLIQEFNGVSGARQILRKWCFASHQHPGAWTQRVRCYVRCVTKAVTSL